MNSLPPLRTVKETPPPRPSVLPAVSDPTPAPRVIPGLEILGTSSIARPLLMDLVQHGLVEAAAIPALLKKVGPILGQLSTRELVGEALITHGFLTRYQLSRVLAGHFHGLVVGGYRVLDRLNSGSVGVVFKALHPVLQRTVALKVMAVEDTTRPDLVDRFTAEVRMLAALDHPHIVRTFDAGVVTPPSPGLPTLHYLALELVPGGDLELFVCDHGPQPVGIVCEWGRQVASALRAAHGAGIVHRDIKPSNLLLTTNRRLKVIDFGLAREYGTARTAAKMLLGSVEFLPPEQLADASTAGPPADIYALASTLFWCLTGQLPYPQEADHQAALKAIRTTAPRRLREIRPEFPAALDELLSKMLARNPGDRPTAAEVAAGLVPFTSPSVHPAMDEVPIIPDDDTEAGHLRFAVRELEDLLTQSRRESQEARNAVWTAIASLVALRPRQSPLKLERAVESTRILAKALLNKAEYVSFASPDAIEDLARAASIRDLGVVGVADALLENPGSLPPMERLRYEAHTIIGLGILDQLAERHGFALPFLRVARAVIRHHHERWDGAGFPDKLVGEHIPPAARIVAVTNAYDALRREMPHVPAMQHLVRQSGTAFDPMVIEALKTVGKEFTLLYDPVILTAEPPAVEGGSKEMLR